MPESPRSNARRVWSDTPHEPPAVADDDDPDDGAPVTIRLATSGRRGRAVTVISGLPRGEVAEIARDLRRSCGSGGSVKRGEIELQGDHRGAVRERLASRFQLRSG